MEPRNPQQGPPESQTPGFERLLREGKHESLNKAKETLKRRLLQSLLQQVLDELKDTEAAADAALDAFSPDEAVFDQARAAIKARLLQQLMSEAIEEIGEEAQEGFEDTSFEDHLPAEGDQVEEASPSEDAARSEDESWTWKATLHPPTTEQDMGQLADPAPSSGQPAEEWNQWEEPEIPGVSQEERAVMPQDPEVPEPYETEVTELEAEGQISPDEAGLAREDEDRPFLDVEEDFEASSPWFKGETLNSESSDASDSGADGAHYQMEHDPALSFDSDLTSVESPAEESATFEAFDEFEEDKTFLQEDNWAAVEEEADDRVDPESVFEDDTFLASPFDDGFREGAEIDEEHHPTAQTFDWADDTDALTTDIDNALGYYVYAVFSGDDVLPLETMSVSGIDPEYPVTILDHSGIQVLVSRVSLDQYDEALLQDHLQDEEWVDNHVRSHNTVLERFMSQVPLLPMRFGEVYPTKQALFEMLDQQLDQLKSALKRTQGQQEWDVRIFSDVEQLRRWVMEESEQVRALLNDIKTKPKDVASDIKRKMVQAIHEGVQAETEACIQSCHEALFEHAEESTTHPVEGSSDEGTEVFHAVYLVPRQDGEPFQDAFERVRAAYQPYGFHFELQGPLYPFASPELTSTDRTRDL